MFRKNKISLYTALSLSLLTSPSFTRASYEPRYLEEGSEEKSSENLRLPSDFCLNRYADLFKNYSLPDLIDLHEELSSTDFLDNLYEIFKSSNHEDTKIDRDEAFQNFINSYCGISYVGGEVEIINSDRIFIHFLPILKEVCNGNSAGEKILTYIGNGIKSYLSTLSKIKNRNAESTVFMLSDKNKNLNFIPPEIGQLEELVSIEIYMANLTTLPVEIAGLKTLKNLCLYKTNLKALPPEIEGLKNLEELFIYSGKLTTLPSEIERLKNLKRLTLYRNNLKTLPSEILDLPLKFLNITANPSLQLSPEMEEELRARVENTWMPVLSTRF